MQDRLAYVDWFTRFYSFKKTDKHCRHLRDAREALFLSAQTVALRVGMSPRAYLYLEKSDVAGTISLNNLRKCAAALGCEFVLELKPKKPFSIQIWEVLVNAVHRPKTQSALAFRAADKMFDPWFRREQGWSINNEEQSRATARSHNRARSSNHLPWLMTKPLSGRSGSDSGGRM